MLFNHVIPKNFEFARTCRLTDFSDLEITIQNARDQVEDIENTDTSQWELTCPDTVDSVFIMATSREVTCIKLLHLNPDNRSLYLDIDGDPEVMPMTLMLIGLQRVTKGNQLYYKIRAEGYTEINEEMTCVDLSLQDSEGAMCGDKLFDNATKKGAEILVRHRLGSKYWIKTEPAQMESSIKIILLQHLDTKETFFFFTENSWKFKSIPFCLRPCSKYRCMTYYGSRHQSEDQSLSFRCKASEGVNYAQNYKVYMTSRIHEFTAYMTKSELQVLMNMGNKFVKRSQNNMAKITFFYRNKPIEYFARVFNDNRGIMKKYMKDNNGDRYSIINKNLEGLFFSALLDPKTFQPPPTSVFGARRLFIYSLKMLNENSNLYFADFYCNYFIHYVTLVITVPNSAADHFCRSRLLKVNIYDNPFIKLQLDRGQFVVMVTTNVHVELFYTESIDIGAARFGQNGFMFQDVPVRGKGTSCPEGIAKKAGCTICNLIPAS